MTPRSLTSDIGIGATDELSLRVSVATLVRVILEHPRDGELLLALERKATLRKSEAGRVVEVKAQPFGGALRIHDLSSLRNLIGDFHFDSRKSRAEQDLRIFIRPTDWEAVREFCLRHLGQLNDPTLETDSTRELTEEFAETLGISLKPHQYAYQAIGTIIEDHPSPTENILAMGHSTARIYRIFEARLLDPALASTMLNNSETCSDQDLRDRALQDSRNGGRGRANTVLTLLFKELNASYLTIPLEARNSPIFFQNHQLDETVAAILEGVSAPKYRRLQNENPS